MAHDWNDARTQHGAVLSIAGAGAPILKPDKRKLRGAHHFHVIVDLPKPDEISGQELQLLRQVLELRRERQRGRDYTAAPAS
eukprot:scaffold154290_cov27-Prasinocladus_malaysianus.AAC.1